MTLAKPEWLLLLFLVPAIVIVSYFAWKRRDQKWKGLVANRLRERLSQTRSSRIYFLRIFLSLGGLALMIIALAEPEAGEEWIEIKSEGRNLLFCIDISRSMLTEDVSPNRLLAARAAALEILDRFPNDRAGILLFSGKVIVQAPLTIDHGFIEQTLAQLDPNDIPTGGSDLTNAIKQGTALLATSGQNNNVMVVFSDGEKSSTGLSDAAQQAKESGIFIYALGFGSEGGFIPDPNQADGIFRDRNGKAVRSELDEESLKTIAQTTNGFYSNGIGKDFLRKLDQALDQMDRFEETGRNQRITKPAYQGFVVAALILLVFSTLLRSVPNRILLVFLALLMSIQQNEAGLFSPDGKEALEEGDYKQAYQSLSREAHRARGDRATQLHLAAGSTAFQFKDWSLAATSFTNALPTSNRVLKKSAHYGLATSLFYSAIPLETIDRIKYWKASAEHFQEALTLDPESVETRENLDRVMSLLQQEGERQQQENQPQEPNKEQSGKQDDSEEQNQSNSPPDSENENSSQDNQDDKSNSDKKNSENESGDQSSEDGNEDSKNGGTNQESEPQETDSDQDQDSAESEKEQDQRNGNANSDNREAEQTTSKQDSSLPQENDREGNDQRDLSHEQNRENPADSSEQSPRERALNILRQYSDLGAKPPQRLKAPFRRSAHDW